MRRSPLAFPLGVVALLLAAAATLPAPSRAEWAAVADVNDLVIKQVGQFAVLVYGLAHRKDLAFLGVVRGQTQEAVGGGTNYRLVVAAARPGADGTTTTAEYDCLVWGVPGSRSDTWKLRRFRKIHS
ncbi:cysteine proteinase inhibitor 5-like [Panicum miliaceum]|uniref:Cysteine proteinase inhibitor 5-like n=1 Tax=Panicum miliaceum TaxID=4540 RepID=A0A3L6TIG7_PANMI|nr:cysteine proteinase inhibitor 5-like [Panicum miliaceum]